MFTGIIEKTTSIKKRKDKQNLIQFAFQKPLSWSLKQGQSITIDGICSTITQITNNLFYVEYMQETINKTTVSFWNKNKLVNLEQSLTLDQKIDGHLLYGHIDTTGTISKIKKILNNVIVYIKIPNKFLPYLVEKGSIAVNGVSLTVIDITKDIFSISLIPYTLKKTNLSHLEENAKVNLEFDIIAKYVIEYIRPYADKK